MGQITNSHIRDINSVIHPYTPQHTLKNNIPFIVESGKGVYVYDASGKAYIEGMSGLWCSGLGFSNEEMTQAGLEQMQKLPTYHLFGNKGYDIATELSEQLKSISPVPISKVLYSSSGSEANDTQIKLAWYYNNALGRPKKKKIISRKNGYHGVTLMSAALTGLTPNHTDFDVSIDKILHADCPQYYRYGLDNETEDLYVDRIANNLEELILREDPDTIAAFIAEPIQGAGGVIIPPGNYFAKIQEILTCYDILLISDEVITGFGRTGNWFGSETVGYTPHTLSVAKQLTAGFAPLSAVLLPQFMVDVLDDQSKRLGNFSHGYTYGGHPFSCAMGVKAIEIYKRDNICDMVKTRGRQFARRLAKLNSHPLIGNVRSSGLVGAVEIVADKKTKRPFDPKHSVGATAVKFLHEKGAILRAAGDIIPLCPPMIISESELDELFDKFELALNECLDWVIRENVY